METMILDLFLCVAKIDTFIQSCEGAVGRMRQHAE